MRALTWHGTHDVRINNVADATCGCRVIGHGTESRDRVYCCGHCAEAADA